MTIFTLAALAALSVLLVLMFGALVELHRQVLQLRQLSGLVDHARPLAYTSGIVLSDLEIPLTQQLPDGERTAVLVLSESCSTCAEIAAHLSSMRYAGIAVVLEAHSRGDAEQWLAMHGLRLGPGIVHDQEGRIAGRLGISVTPAVIKFDGQYPFSASTVPSTRQLDRVVEWLGSAHAPAQRTGAGS